MINPFSQLPRLTPTAPPKSLTGALQIAIQSAEQHGTDLYFMQNGQIIALTPAQVRAAL